ncbi:hypothetical protein ACQCVP_16560 [Rossellomorea vietnamensis]|uniref:hypothetical protein n=1 Tax=Rossellomorea vietnamensis TaxID=218284 RepID=UPI003CE95F72
MKQEKIKSKVIIGCSIIMCLCAPITLFFDESPLAGYAFFIGFLTAVVFSIALIVEE